MTVAIQTQFDNVSPKLTLVSREQEGDTLSTEYKCTRTVVLAGDSIWDCTLKTVCITGIHITETDYDGDGDISTHIAVVYNVNGNEDYEDSWRLYTDSGFAEVVSKLLGCDVSYTEQGMQQDNYASMEL
jgi:GTP:adenosylcobinamide-phosphate guanylyltransferase